MKGFNGNLKDFFNNSKFISIWREALQTQKVRRKNMMENNYLITVPFLEEVFQKEGTWFNGRGSSFAFQESFIKNYPNVYHFDKEKFVLLLNQLLNQYGITGPYHQAHFLSQCFHESAHFETTIEFASGNAYDPSHNPNASQHGNTENGDGPKYKGRGLIQLTWKNNYKKYSEFRGVDFVSNPDLIAQDMRNAIDVSCWFWRNNGAIYKKYNAKGDINVLIDNEKNNVELVTRAVNGGTNGLADREKFFNRIKEKWKLE